MDDHINAIEHAVTNAVAGGMSWDQLEDLLDSIKGTIGLGRLLDQQRKASASHPVPEER